MARQKLKTHRGAAKRFSITKNGKIRRSKAYARHLLTCKSAKRKRKFRSSSTVSAGEVKNLKRLLPYA
ncbi:MAG: 50S ribosomal protein L35 [Leptospirillia bacterium]